MGRDFRLGYALYYFPHLLPLESLPASSHYDISNSLGNIPAPSKALPTLSEASSSSFHPKVLPTPSKALSAASEGP